MSLKLNLHNLIKTQGYISLDQLEDYCHKAHYKLATAERQLRPSQSPQVEGVWNTKRTAIIGYKWKGSNVATGGDYCCNDKRIFGECWKKHESPVPAQIPGALF